MNKLIFLLLLISSTALQASQVCSRVAIINYQEILVDTSSTQKGEGLRYYLEKDPQAKDYLDEYQDGTKIKWQNAAIGTLGSGLIIGGLFADDGTDAKKTMLVGGAALIIVNFFIARTLEFNNEQNLNKAIEEYNKRNLPKIFFYPDGLPSDSGQSPGLGMAIIKDWSF
ncbi:MAG: hypothetical protein COW01_01020 [Bdellovibrionales bacterium CG12_big_fil_rev_8_21_14_0_65_38_15]|nr:MAG: hypothetical protein COW79_05280 [Bdellovibrionales bacterium CG22_combo_CG10-13_8_21_14_all_38_13]PIQ57338.1 MAG: hypothetical protein COW01_01020 [Bdellovibrionales bacterium CG12_big_fil_rev_8_21_14_0_65_38_15]PIR28883.1 MAG: hypothetical protein COV38_13610 [Bdellovibrionales bacterium CG11_big_fil_rev_8_21_14_0_20_38_13]